MSNFSPAGLRRPPLVRAGSVIQLQQPLRRIDHDRAAPPDRPSSRSRRPAGSAPRRVDRRPPAGCVPSARRRAVTRPIARPSRVRPRSRSDRAGRTSPRGSGASSARRHLAARRRPALSASFIVVDALEPDRPAVPGETAPTRSVERAVDPPAPTMQHGARREALVRKIGLRVDDHLAADCRAPARCGPPAVSRPSASCDPASGNAARATGPGIPAAPCLRRAPPATFDERPQRGGRPSLPADHASQVAGRHDQLDERLAARAAR